MKLEVRELATLLAGRIVGDPSVVVSRFRGVDQAGPGDITFVAQEKYFPLLAATEAAAVVVDREHAQCAAVQIVVADANLAFARLVDHWQRRKALGDGGIHPRAAVDPTAQVDPTAAVRAGAVVGARTKVGPRSVIGAATVLGDDVVVGADCILHPNVTVADEVQIGSRVILHPGVVIGSDGFGYATDATGIHQKIPQTGIVVLEDDVEIGANTTVDRARFAETRIGQGTKIDNLVQIGHNVVIGPHCIIVAQSGIAGSTTLGRHVLLAAKVGVAGHLHLGDGVQVAAMSGVGRDLEAGGKFVGVPAIPFADGQRVRLFQIKLPEMHQKLRDLTRRLTEIEQKLGQRPPPEGSA